MHGTSSRSGPGQPPCPANPLMQRRVRCCCPVLQVTEQPPRLVHSDHSSLTTTTWKEPHKGLDIGQKRANELLSNYDLYRINL